MGILNVTPDSFFDGGQFVTEAAILRHVEKMLLDGADFIDIGGYSSRPGAGDPGPEEEKARVSRAVAAVCKAFPEAIISVDTFRSDVAEAAVNAGAALINDIAGGNLDNAMFDTVARLGVPYILMHMRGTPENMNRQTHYTNLMKEVLDYFHHKIFELRQREVKDVIVDPGFGFSKTPAQNFHLLAHLEKFSILGRPLLTGLSRKSMIWKTLGTDPAGALNGTTALNMVALSKGANILRVHDVKEARELTKLFSSLQANAQT